MAMEWKGGRVGGKILLNKLLMRVCSDSAAAHERWKNCGGKPVLGKDHMKHYESNQRSGQRVQKFIEQVHEKASFLASQSQTTVFVGQWME